MINIYEKIMLKLKALDINLTTETIVIKIREWIEWAANWLMQNVCHFEIDDKIHFIRHYLCILFIRVFWKLNWPIIF